MDFFLRLQRHKCGISKHVFKGFRNQGGELKKSRNFIVCGTKSMGFNKISFQVILEPVTDWIGIK